MNKYIKPTISLLSTEGLSNLPTSCATSGNAAKDVLDLIKDMGVSPEMVFGVAESCMVSFDDYCKFTYAIQVFLS